MYRLSKIAQRVKSIPALSVSMSDENEEVVPIPEGQKDFMCPMDYTNTDKSMVPDDFNGMVVWKDLMSATQNQDMCGSCWSFASVTTLADRFNVISKKKIIPMASPNFSLLCAVNEDLLDMTKVLQTQGNTYQSNQLLQQKLSDLNAKEFACGGNYLITAFCFLYVSGTCTDACLPYKLVDPFKQQYALLDFGFNGRTAFLDYSSADAIKTKNFFFLLDKTNSTWSCSSIVGNNKEICWAHTVLNNQMLSIPLRHYHCGLIYQIKDDRDLDLAIRYDIFKYGPVATVMNLFDDFFSFDPVNDGVYAPRQSLDMSSGGHAVQIVGWGTLNGTKFWWIRNSWGTEWGIQGCFRLERANKSCAVEENVISCIPNFFFSPDQYDTFLDDFEKNNPITITEPYRNCIRNVWMKKYFAIYYKPIQIDLFRDTLDGERITYFRILAEHPGQKAVFYPRYGLTTKIMSVYPSVLKEPDPDPDIILDWFRFNRFASDTSPHMTSWSVWWKGWRNNKTLLLGWLNLVCILLIIFVISVIVYRIIRHKEQYRNTSSQKMISISQIPLRK